MDDRAGRGLSGRPESTAVPEGNVAERGPNPVLGPLALCASLGVQAILGAILLFRPQPASGVRLTRWGTMFYRPEHDVDFYVAGVAVTLGLMLVVAVWWGRLRVPPSRPALLFRCLLAAAVLVPFLFGWLDAAGAVSAGRGPGSGRLLLFAVLGVATAAAGLPFERARAWRRNGTAGDVQARGQASAPGDPDRRTVRAEPTGRRQGSAPAGPDGQAAPEVPAAPAFSPAELLVPVVIFLLVWVPSSEQLAGLVFRADAFFHWDYYVMGPALALGSGIPLGTDYYAMYGVGWPAFFDLLSGWVPLTYGRVIQAGSLYACLYFTGAYLLLRSLTRRRRAAAAGTALAGLQLFLGMGGSVVWILPSLTVLRWAFDVWCFLALAGYLRTGRRVWAVTAGACAGLALVFGIDTGIYLVAAAAFFWVCTAAGDDAAPVRAVDALWAACAGLAAAVAGLAVAGRGTILSLAFWAGWLEPLRDYKGGFAQVPVTLAGAGTIAAFAGLAGFYLTVTGWSLEKVVRRSAALHEVAAGTFALYGLMNLVHFAGRSVEGTLFRLTLPLAFVVTLLAAGALQRSGRSGAAGQRRRRLWAAGAAAVVALAGLAAAPPRLLREPIRAYPNLVSAASGDREPAGVCLLRRPRDVCGLPAGFRPVAGRFQAMAERLRALEREGRSVAVVDESGMILNLASGQEPFGRYPRLFLNVYRQEQLTQVVEELGSRDPDYVLTRSPLEEADPAYEAWAYFGVGPRQDTPYPDTWSALLGEIERGYELEERFPPFELWGRRVSPGP